MGQRSDKRAIVNGGGPRGPAGLSRTRRLAALLFLVLGACTAGETEKPADAQPRFDPWVSDRGQGHPLAGRIWRPANGAFVDAERLLSELSKAYFVILGETHDNPDHHRIQAWAVEGILARGRRPALAFEMFTSDQAGELRAQIAREPRDAAGLGPALGWDRRGWPAWRHYQPIAQAALDAGAPILAADPSRAALRDVTKDGPAALGADAVARLRLEQPPQPEVAASLRREIVDAHCNQLPESMIDPMTTMMWVRDAYMAGALVQGADLPGRDGAVLIAGNGHARRDQGVPYQLRRLAPGRRALSLGLVEVADGETDPGGYAGRFNSSALPYDFVWFTPRPAREPACERFADQLRQAKERHLDERESP